MRVFKYTILEYRAHVSMTIALEGMNYFMGLSSSRHAVKLLFSSDIYNLPLGSSICQLSSVTSLYAVENLQA